jgi:hypothetical protein
MIDFQTEESKTIQDAMICLVKDYRKDEEFPRLYLLREARKNNLYDFNIQNLFLDSLTGDWRTFDSLGQLQGLADIDEDLVDYDYKIINIYSAYKESIVAALSNQVPTTRFLPDNANNPQDIYTAEAFQKVAELLRRTNKSKTLLIQMLSILYNEGVIGVYNFADKDEKYGMATVPREGVFKDVVDKDLCPECGSVLEENVLPAQEVEADYQAESGLVASDKTLFCPTCQIEVNPLTEHEEELGEGVVGYDQVPKLREQQQVFGITNLRFPAYCMDQESIPVLELEYELDIALVEQIYPHLRGKINETNVDLPDDNKWARQNPAYFSSIPMHTCTVRQIWIREWAFNRLKDTQYEFAGELGEGEEAPKISEYLKENFPKGCRLVLINENIFAEAYEENLDDHWTLSINPMYKQLIGKALGSRITPIQDIKNDVVNLKKQTIEQGIPQTFVDPTLLDMDRYKNTEIRPGMVIPVKSGSVVGGLSNGFYQTTTASLSPEVNSVEEVNQADGQFASGAFPSIYGGVMEGTNTAAEYSMSRSQALQRLMLTWAMICDVWSRMEFKSVQDFAKNLDYDDHFVTKEGSGFKNVYIELVKLKGKVADIESEASENFPLSWAQKGDLIRDLMKLDSDPVNQVLMHPENASTIASYIGVDEIYIPGDEDSKKQKQEIYLLCQGVPEGMNPSVMPENDLAQRIIVDDDYVHSETCKCWLNSAEGQMYKRDHPEQYLNVLLHKRIHDINQSMLAPAPVEEKGNENKVSNPAA